MDSIDGESDMRSISHLLILDNIIAQSLALYLITLSVSLYKKSCSFITIIFLSLENGRNTADLIPIITIFLLLITLLHISNLSLGGVFES